MGTIRTILISHLPTPRREISGEGCFCRTPPIERSDPCLQRLELLLPNNQRQHRTLHVRKDVLPYVLCYMLCPVSAALASIFRMYPISTSCKTNCRRTRNRPRAVHLPMRFVRTVQLGCIPLCNALDLSILLAFNAFYFFFLLQ